MTAIEKIREIDPYLACKMEDFAEPILNESEKNMSYKRKADLAGDSHDKQIFELRALIAKTELFKMLKEIRPLFFDSWFEHPDEYNDLAYDITGGGSYLMDLEDWEVYDGWKIPREKFEDAKKRRNIEPIPVKPPPEPTIDHVRESITDPEARKIYDKLVEMEDQLGHGKL